MRYGIVEGNNVAKKMRFRYTWRWKDFLLPYDVLVLDNASIHTSGVNSTLKDWLRGNF